MLLSAFPPQNPLPNSTPPPHYPHPPLLPRYLLQAAATPTVHASSQRLPPLTLTNAAATSSTTLRHVSGTCSDDDGDGDGDSMVTSASAVAAAIRNASTSLVEFVQTIEKDDGKNRGLVLPSVDFQRLCLEQSELFRRIVHPDSVLSRMIEGALLRIQAGGKVEIIATGAPAGGALVIIDDDGLDMHHMACVMKSIHIMITETMPDIKMIKCGT